jgi:selenide, water dikinase
VTIVPPREGPVRLVLVGGGHAHLGVLEALAREKPEGLHVTLISAGERALYSGMVPGWLGGDYDFDQITFDLPALCRRAGVTFVPTPADRLLWTEEAPDPSGGPEPSLSDPLAGGGGTVLAGGEAHPFELASLDIGSVPRGRELPGVREHAFALRPMERARVLEEALVERVHEVGTRSAVRVVVVGGGAAGFEVALAVERRLEREGGLGDVTLLESGPRILPGMSDRVGRRAEAILSRRGIEVRCDLPVHRVERDGVVVEGDRILPSDLTIWATGAAPPPLLAASTLPLDEAGYFQVDASLRSVDGAPVWGAGDCIGLAGHPEMPKAGVYAVRQSPILARNLLAAATGAPSKDPHWYAPQRGFLALMNTADGKALLRWKGIVVHTWWAWWLKDRIDRRFVARYQALESSEPGGVV